MLDGALRVDRDGADLHPSSRRPELHIVEASPRKRTDRRWRTLDRRNQRRRVAVRTGVRGLHHEHKARHFVRRHQIAVRIGDRISPVRLHRVGHCAALPVGKVFVGDSQRRRVDGNR